MFDLPYIQYILTHSHTCQAHNKINLHSLGNFVYEVSCEIIRTANCYEFSAARESARQTIGTIAFNGPQAQSYPPKFPARQTN